MANVTTIIRSAMVLAGVLTIGLNVGCAQQREALKAISVSDVAAACDGLDPGLKEAEVCDAVATKLCGELAAEFGLIPDENPLWVTGFECVAHPVQGPCPVEFDPWVDAEANVYCVAPVWWANVSAEVM